MISSLCQYPKGVHRSLDVLGCVVRGGELRAPGTMNFREGRGSGRLSSAERLGVGHLGKYRRGFRQGLSGKENRSLAVGTTSCFVVL